MRSEDLRQVQAPLKQRYRDEPEVAIVHFKAVGTVGLDDITCTIQTERGPMTSGLHPATGGDGLAACSGDLLLEALVACAGVTLRAVATAMDIPIRAGTVVAETDLDFRGTLGVSKDAPVGFTDIQLRFDLDTEATDEQLEKLLALTERYCVVAQTLRSSPHLAVSHRRTTAR